MFHKLQIVYQILPSDLWFSNSSNLLNIYLQPINSLCICRQISLKLSTFLEHNFKKTHKNIWIKIKTYQNQKNEKQTWKQNTIIHAPHAHNEKKLNKIHHKSLPALMLMLGAQTSTVMFCQGFIRQWYWRFLGQLCTIEEQFFIFSLSVHADLLFGQVLTLFTVSCDSLQNSLL